MTTISEKMDKVLSNQARHEEKLDAYAREQAKHAKILFGPDDLPGGIVMDVDRNKRAIKIACWFLTAIILASISVGGKLIYTNIAKWNADTRTMATPTTAGS